MCSFPGSFYLRFGKTEVPLSLFGSYRFVFNTEGMPKKIGINVYNKDKDSKKRDLLFSNADSLETNTTLIFDPKKHTRKIFINYDVPADTLNLKIKGCVYFVLGYK
jgi:GH43 family beta-xylosidase